MWQLSPSGQGNNSPRLPPNGDGGHEAVHHHDHRPPSRPHGDPSHLCHCLASQGKEILHQETGSDDSQVSEGGFQSPGI